MTRSFLVPSKMPKGYFIRYYLKKLPHYKTLKSIHSFKKRKLRQLFITYLFKNGKKHSKLSWTAIFLITERCKKSIEFLKCDKSNDRNAKNLSKKLQKYTIKKLKKCRPFYQNQFSDEKSFFFASFSSWLLDK